MQISDSIRHATCDAQMIDSRMACSALNSATCAPMRGEVRVGEAARTLDNALWW